MGCGRCESGRTTLWQKRCWSRRRQQSAVTTAISDHQAEERTAENPAKARRRLPRIPTSVVMTLLAIALPAWLLPAFTRQWDDRQQAHDLKAAITSDMATATAGALFGRSTQYQPRPNGS